jgi:hypothetical protein
MGHGYIVGIMGKIPPPSDEFQYNQSSVEKFEYIILYSRKSLPKRDS